MDSKRVPPPRRRNLPTPRRFEETVDPEEALEALEALHVVQERLVSDRLGELVEAVRGRDAAERALAGIVLDTLGEKEELAHVLTLWKGREDGYAAAPRKGRASLADLLEGLLDVKRSAARRYWTAAAACDDEDLAERLRRLASQSSEHAAILLTMRADVMD